MNSTHISDSYDFVKRTLLSVPSGGKGFLVVPMFTDAPRDELLNSYFQFLSTSHGAKNSIARSSETAAPVTRVAANWINKIRREMKDLNRNIFLDPDIGIRFEGKMPKDRSKFVGINEIGPDVCNSEPILKTAIQNSLNNRRQF